MFQYSQRRATFEEDTHLESGTPGYERKRVLPMPRMSNQDALLERSSTFVRRIYCRTHLLCCAVYVFDQG